MEKQGQSYRQSRTRTLIQAAGLLQKSKLLEDFRIETGEDLQAREILLDICELSSEISQFL